ncbi:MULTISPECIES: alpha/beta hydrolase [unclassified Amycolatopsis]|uniref:alpha/beta hydrolase family protein n=1 Tax=unclassified Amycolatopsis TaxID=2618356 RepID=UPI0028751D92|nr:MULTISPECIES: alpha/beta hydrolase [unclassified Amycolatopsis]MDS0138853.1 alpha/beta hydrolase [Amycolatopsis sp. 505]MDS0147347.1 alpha/beta hydrolase [Amycolatopsis sp. CM201R]
MRKTLLTAGLAGVLLLTALPAHAATRLSLPAPTGPYAVGSVDLHLVDHARPDPWVAGTTRELMVTVRYPARSGGGGAKAPYQAPEAAEVIAEEDARALGIAADRLGYTFPTHARAGVPAAGGRRPVVLFSPSAKYPRSVGTTLLEQLASEGYVTVAIDHTHEPAAVEFPGGRVERRVLPSGPDAGRQLIATRVADTRFVLDALETLARGGNPDAEHRPLPAGLAPDVSRTGMFGHSAGGFTTGETMVSDPRLDAGADLDGSMSYSQSNREYGRVADEGLDQPFLLLSAGDHSTTSDPSWQEFLAHQRGPVRAQHLPDGEHFSYTDYQVLLPRLGLDPAAIAPFVGTVDPDRSIATQRATLSEFFACYLERR